MSNGWDLVKQLLNFTMFAQWKKSQKSLRLF